MIIASIHSHNEPALLGSIIFTAQSDGANILCSPVLLDNDKIEAVLQRGIIARRGGSIAIHHHHTVI